jgi:hypothetical protein
VTVHGLALNHIRSIHVCIMISTQMHNLSLSCNYPWGCTKDSCHDTDASGTILIRWMNQWSDCTAKHWLFLPDWSVIHNPCMCLSRALLHAVTHSVSSLKFRGPSAVTRLVQLCVLLRSYSSKTILGHNNIILTSMTVVRDKWIFLTLSHKLFPVLQSYKGDTYLDVMFQGTS